MEASLVPVSVASVSGAFGAGTGPDWSGIWKAALVRKAAFSAEVVGDVPAVVTTSWAA